MKNQNLVELIFFVNYQSIGIYKDDTMKHWIVYGMDCNFAEGMGRCIVKIVSESR